MSDNLDADNADVIDESGPQTVVGQLRDDVDAMISSRKPSIVSIVMDRLVNAEINRLAELLFQGLEAHAKLRRDFLKIRPDLLAFDGNGQKTSEAYSKTKVQEKKKAADQLQRLTAALTTAISNGGYDKLQEFLATYKPGGDK